jgi:Flp pilus assembly pilin Flp
LGIICFLLLKFKTGINQMNKSIAALLKAFLADENGAETVEWVMVAAFMAAVITASFNSTLRTAVTAAIARIVTALGIT